MNTNELAIFNDSVNTLIQGQLILVDKHIANVLKCVASSPVLCKTLADTVKTMSYATEFSRAIVRWTRSDGVTESRLKLPLDRNRLFAFVVCLLAEVDSGRRNLLEFLKEYYNDSNNDASYARFAEEVLKPFKRVGENLLSTVDPDSVNTEFVEQAEQYYRAEKIYIKSGITTAILDTIEAIRVQLTTKRLTPNEVAEASTVSEYLVNALYLKNPKILKLAWIAYKNTMAKSEVYEGLIKLGEYFRQISL